MKAIGFEKLCKLAALIFLALAFSIVIAVPIYHGLDRFFLSNSDPDLDFTYQALSLNAGDPLRFHPHTAHGYVLILAYWLKFVSWIGFIDHSSIIPIASAPNFEFAYSPVILAGRILSILLAISLLIVMWWLIYLLTRSQLAAALASFLVATSHGMEVQYAIMRTELSVMVFILLALAFLVLAIEKRGWGSVCFVGMAVALSVFASIVKLQAIIILAFIPLLPLFLVKPGSTEPPNGRYVLGLLIFTLAFCANAGTRWWEAISQASSISYQPLLPLLVVCCIIIYGRLASLDRLWVLATICASAIGATTAFYSIYLSDNWWTPYGMVNFLHYMSMDAIGLGNDKGPIGIIWNTLDSLKNLISKYFLEDQISSRKYMFQLIFIATLIIASWEIIKRNYRKGLLLGYLLFMGLILPAIFSSRGYYYYYYIFVESWLVLALMVGCSRFFKARSLSANTVTTVILMMCLGIGLFQVRYRALAPTNANTRQISHICCYVSYATRIEDQLSQICRPKKNEGCHINWPDIFKRQELLLKSFPQAK